VRCYAQGELQVLDSLVKAAEKVVLLLEYRERRQRLRYDIAVAPLYKNLGEVHADYLQMFRSVSEGLLEGNDLALLARNTYATGYLYDPLRKDLVARLSAFSSGVSEPTFRAFYKSAIAYLSPPDRLALKVAVKQGVAISTIRSMVYQVLVAAQKEEEREKLAGRPLTPAQREMLSVFVEETASKTRKSWEHVAAAHAAAQLATLP
jgi:hypothetical protein